MKYFKQSIEQFTIGKLLVKWLLLAVPLSLVTGSLVAMFLFLLEAVTHLRWHNHWLVFLLPIAGIGIHFLYVWAGKNAAAGNNLIIDEIHEPGGGVPLRMTPLVLVATLVTHLFGGSAGREGTAVQMGGSIAGFFGKVFRLGKDDLRIFLMMGLAAGFGAVFGTPLAGCVFALEVLSLGKVKYEALLPCLFAAVLSDRVCAAYGIHHTQYTIQPHLFASPPIYGVPSDVIMLLKVALVGILFGCTSQVFIRLTHGVKSVSESLLSQHKWLIPLIGGSIIILLTLIAGHQDYNGLGVLPETPGSDSIVTAFRVGGVSTFGWFWKLLFTAITLGTGFKGGEVTPLFFIGAALGSTLAVLTGTSIDLFAGLGFIAVFAGATNTPLACTLMGVELFGGEYVLYFAVACFVAYYFSGHASIYGSQRVAVPKHTGLRQELDGDLPRIKEIKKPNHN